MSVIKLTVVMLCCALATACQHAGQNTYSAREVGKAALVKFGVIIAQREVDVVGRNTGVGAVGGGVLAGSAAAASGARGIGALVAVMGGAVAGGLIEQAASDRKATEFIVTLETGQTITVVQDHAEGDAPLNVGDRVMVQIMGRNQRVLPASALPTEVQRPQGVKLVD